MGKDSPPESSGIILYTADDGSSRIRVLLQDEMVWLPQRLIAELYQVSVKTINEHIVNIFNDHELEPQATIRKFRIVQQEGNRTVTRNIEHYNLDMILAVGYRVRSQRGVQFRQWATERLREYLVKGFTLDDERLKGLGGLEDHFDELRARISGIRSLNSFALTTRYPRLLRSIFPLFR